MMAIPESLFSSDVLSICCHFDKKYIAWKFYQCVIRKI